MGRSSAAAPRSDRPGGRGSRSKPASSDTRANVSAATGGAPQHVVGAGERRPQIPSLRPILQIALQIAPQERERVGRPAPSARGGARPAAAAPARCTRSTPCSRQRSITAAANGAAASERLLRAGARVRT